MPILYDGGVATATGTTVVENMTVSGELSVDGIISDPSGNQVIMPDSGITVIGDAGSTSNSLSANDDLFVSGKLEVDGVSYFDGGIQLPNNQTIGIGAGLSFFRWHTGQTSSSTVWALDSTSNTIIFTQSGDHTFDFGHAAQSDPTLFVHSANQATDEWISITHNRTDACIGWGTGVLDFAGGSVNAVTVTHDENWDVKIGGVAKKIMLGS